jgi:hypothetical protein
VRSVWRQVTLAAIDGGGLLPRLGARTLTSKGVVFLLLFRQAKRAIEIMLSVPCPHRAFGLEPFEVRQVAKGSEAECLQEFPRRHIGEGGAG